MHDHSRNPYLTKEHQARFLEMAGEAGFDLSGFAPASVSDEDRSNIEEFAQQNQSNDIHWFNHHLNLRTHPSDILPGALSVLMLGTIYRHPDMDEALQDATAKISRYAAGKDYHLVLRKKAARMADQFYETHRDELAWLKYRVTCDSAPVPEKLLARNAGLGWQGKNTNLIHPEMGSYFFLTGIFLNADLEGGWPDSFHGNQSAKDEELSLFRAANVDRCGSCRQCLDACPTGALEPYRIQADLCLSYWTIESRSDMPEAIASNAEGWVFGCDICQEVCPYNRGAKGRRQITKEKSFEPRPAVLEWLRNSGDPANGDPAAKDTWAELSVSSPLKRAGLDRFRASWKNCIRNAHGEDLKESERKD